MIEPDADRDAALRRLRFDEGPAMRWLKAGGGLLALALALGVAWSVTAELPEVAKSRGAVEPLADIRRVESVHGGLLKEVFVRTGDVVSAGDALVSFDDDETQSTLDEARDQLTALELEAERLLAQIENRAPDFRAVPGADSAQMARERAALTARRALIENQLEEVRAQIVGKRVEISAIDAERPALQRELEAARADLATARDLVDRGLAARPRLIAAIEAEARFTYDLAELDGRRDIAAAEIDQLEATLARIRSSEAAQIRERLAEIEAESETLRDRIDGLEARLEDTRIFSPIDGVVQTAPDETTGDVIEPGGLVAEIVPHSEGARFVGRLPVRDVAFVEIGQPARLKVDSFDFGRYGALEGRVEDISATAIVDERGVSFYEVRIVVPTPYFRNDPVRLGLRPGMTAEADIVTGSKTVFEYIWKPIYTNLDLAFTER